MRLTLVTCWLSLCLFAPTLRADPTSAVRGEVKEPAAKPLWQDKVVGIGSDPKDAERSALWNAAVRVQEWMRERHPEFEWRVSPEYLRTSGISGEPISLEKGSDATERAEVVVRVTQKQHDALLEHDRSARAAERHHLWGALLAAMVVLLGLVAGYLRLEDATQGYLTRALRVTLLLGVAATLAALWFVVQ